MATPTRADQPDLESRIGSHWLNRIGIAAVLIGVSYFLKYAFDNNWIGPAGRVTIGLLAGIAIGPFTPGFVTIPFGDAEALAMVDSGQPFETLAVMEYGDGGEGFRLAGEFFADSVLMRHQCHQRRVKPLSAQAAGSSNFSS